MSSSIFFWCSSVVCEHRLFPHLLLVLLRHEPPSDHRVLLVLTSPHVALGIWLLPTRWAHVTRQSSCLEQGLARPYSVHVYRSQLSPLPLRELSGSHQLQGRCFVYPFRSILPGVLPRDHSESRTSQSFSQVMFELPVFSFDEGDFPVVFQACRESIFPLRLHPLQASRGVRNQTKCVVCRPIVLVPGPHFLPHLPPLSSSQQYVPGHRYRLKARSLHWVNRMPSDQGGQQYFFAPPSLVFPDRPGDCRSQRGTSLFPCISTFNSKSILRHACRHNHMLSLFKGEDTPDRANSVDRGRRLCSSLILHLTIPLLPL